MSCVRSMHQSAAKQGQTDQNRGPQEGPEDNDVMCDPIWPRRFGNSQISMSVPSRCLNGFLTVLRSTLFRRG